MIALGADFPLLGSGCSGMFLKGGGGFTGLALYIRVGELVAGLFLHLLSGSD